MNGDERGSRKLSIGLAIAAIAVVLLVVGVVLLAGGGSFAELVDLTREAEGAEVWRSYFTAEDCLLDALTEDPEAVGAAIERLQSQTTALADHVDVSLTNLEGFGTRPWQGNLRSAQQAIVDHYLVWEEHLAAAGPVLEGISSEPSSISDGITSWFELAQNAVEPIGSTFDEAGVAFEEAAETDEDQQVIESLFVPADVSCTRTAV